MTATTVTPVDPLADPGWDRFVASRPQSTAYHLAAWVRIIASSYRFDPACLCLRDGAGEIRGVLPLMAKRGPVSGKRLRSMPGLPTGGPVADSAEGETALLAHACERARDERRELVVESRSAGLERADPGIDTFEKPPSWMLELPRDDLDGWLGGRSKNLRRSINKAERAGLVVRQASSEDELRTFYRLYLSTMRGHRSLPRLFRQFRLARELLQDAGVFKLFLVEKDGSPVAGGVWHQVGDTIELLYNASDPRALPLRPNHALYRHVVGWGVEHGLTRLDFGFAWPGGSLGTFKQAWGAQPWPEYGYRFGARGNGATRAGPGPRNPVEPGDGEGMAWRLWGRAPLSLTRAVGGFAYRYL